LKALNSSGTSVEFPPLAAIERLKEARGLVWVTEQNKEKSSLEDLRGVCSLQNKVKC
jgi:hypothetical protein